MVLFALLGRPQHCFRAGNLWDSEGEQRLADPLNGDALGSEELCGG